MITFHGLSILPMLLIRLKFLKRHLSKCSSNVKASTCLLMVYPLMEYMHVLSGTHIINPKYQSWKRFKGVQRDGFYLTTVITVV